MVIFHLFLYERYRTTWPPREPAGLPISRTAYIGAIKKKGSLILLADDLYAKVISPRSGLFEVADGTNVTHPMCSRCGGSFIVPRLLLARSDGFCDARVLLIYIVELVRRRCPFSALIRQEHTMNLTHQARERRAPSRLAHTSISGVCS